MKKVAIVITTFNQEILLGKCLASLKRKTDYKNYKVFLVDDASKIEIGKKIKKKFPWIKLIVNKNNLGFAKSYNIGIKTSLKNYNPDYILLLNDDTEIIQKNWLSNMIKVGEGYENIGILGCRVVYRDGSLQFFAINNKAYFFENKGKKLKSKEIYSTQKIKKGGIIGACFLIKRKIFKKIGLLDEKFSPFYGEESDYCERVRKAGFDIGYVGDSEIIHLGAKSTSTIPYDKVWYIKKKNAIRLEWLNHSFGEIIKYSLIHWASVFFKRNNISLFKKFFLLFKAYVVNLENLGEILRKRYERNKKL